MGSVAPITVLTVTIPGRERLLAEQVASINAQSIPVRRQLICSHPLAEMFGMQPMTQYTTAKNELLEIVDTTWIAVLNDDDLWLAHHIETVIRALDGADVVYSWDADGSRPRINVNDWSRYRLARQMDRGNIIDGNCLIRLEPLLSVGGFPTDWVGGAPHAGGHYARSPANFEDWELWRRLLTIGARFRCVPTVTWRYRTWSPTQINAPRQGRR